MYRNGGDRWLEPHIISGTTTTFSGSEDALASREEVAALGYGSCCSMFVVNSIGDCALVELGGEWQDIALRPFVHELEYACTV